MHWIFVCMIVPSFYVLGSTKDIETNDIHTSPTSVTLDSNLRKALLKALTELENEELEKLSSETSDNQINLVGRDNENNSKSFERASASAVSIITNSGAKNTYAEIISTTSTTNAPSLKPIVVVQRSNGIQQNPITTFLQSKEHREQFLSSSSKFNVPKDEGIHTRSVSVNGNLISQNVVHHNDKYTSFGSKDKLTEHKIATTTSIPTPVTEEHEAKVEDVQFFPAPLVAAFTVHQDASGLPNKVEPIYKPAVRDTLVSLRNVLTPSPMVSTSFTPEDQSNLNKNSLENQFFLREKQNALEQHIHNLQQQQLKQHEYLIRQQKIIQEQEQRLNGQRILSENDRLIQQQAFPLQQPSNPLNLSNNKLNNYALKDGKNHGNTLVSLQQSLPLNLSQQQLLQAGILPQNAQILPIKNAVDFLSSPYNQISFNQFHETTSQQNLPRNVNNNFQSFPNSFVQTLPSVETNRFFRQETGVSNFRNGVNSRPNNNFNQFIPSASDPILPHTNRVFRSNSEGVHTSNFHYQGPSFVNQQLNNLLYQSGISRGVRQSEDLGIVSKVLSYNFGRDGFARADV